MKRKWLGNEENHRVKINDKNENSGEQNRGDEEREAKRKGKERGAGKEKCD